MTAPHGWRTIGVLGGMGPAATADFLDRMVRAVGAARDQDHPPVLVYSAASIPDRTSHLLGEGEDPTAALVEAGRLLQTAGAELLAIPCNSAHAYLEALREALRVPVLDMPRLAARECGACLERGGRIGLLAASGTARLGLYEAPLREEGLQAVLPASSDQETVMDVVRQVKAGGGGRHDPRIDGVTQRLREAGAEALLLACTELPLAVQARRLPLPVVDATDVLVTATLQAARIDAGEGD